MTLSRFLRDYLYIPLGGNRKGSARRYLNVMITMLLGGLWHGANWTFIVWGGLHGCFLLVNHLSRALRPPQAEDSRPRAAVVRALKVLATFLAVVTAFVFFRAASLAKALQLLAGMIGLHGSEAVAAALGKPATWHETALVALAIAIVWCAPNVHQIMGRYSPALTTIAFMPARWLAWRPNLGWAVAIAAVAAAAIFGVSGHVVFLYAYF